ncbi:MAG: ferric iron uptake transcriptional regulator, partial [Gammaproteobacteria bacterium PRO9]|nr:ferric iron uptake transcriptional regulator [Gammaproteobacteria bacterium PRO9]
MKPRELQKAGLKITTPRLRILEILQEGGSNHLSAEDIYRRLVDAGDDVGLATVYRVLTQFEQAGLVTRHNFATNHSVFELDSGRHHDHMVCVETGQVIEFSNEEIERIQHDIAGRHGFDIVDHSLVLYVRPKAADPADSPPDPAA